MIDELVGRERTSEENLFFLISALRAYAQVSTRMIIGRIEYRWWPREHWHKTLFRLNCTFDVLRFRFYWFFTEGISFDQNFPGIYLIVIFSCHATSWMTASIPSIDVLFVCEVSPLQHALVVQWWMEVIYSWQYGIFSGVINHEQVQCCVRKADRSNISAASSIETDVHPWCSSHSRLSENGTISNER